MNLFISAIDTDSGKTMITGLLAKSLLDKGFDVVTAKLVQTGCQGVADDIRVHRRLMGTGLLSIDGNGGTCPYVFGFPASPHLSARMEGKSVDPLVLDAALHSLELQYPLVITEGAGGLMVPLAPDLLTIDYVASRKMPIVLVTSAKLGSINHTLLSLEACTHRGIQVEGVVFNRYPSTHNTIAHESASYLKHYLSVRYPLATWDELPVFNDNNAMDVGGLFPNLIAKLVRGS